MRAARSSRLLSMLFYGAFEEHGVYEGLGEVAAELALADVEFFGEQRGGSAGSAGSFEPACGGEVVVLLGVGERHPEAAE